MVASRSEALARGRATYQDVIDAPAHQVAEIVDGTELTKFAGMCSHHGGKL